MTDDRQGGESDFAQDLRTRGHVTPGENCQVLCGKRLLEFRMRLGGIGRKKDYSHGQGLGGVESDAGRGEQEVAGDGGSDADAIAGLAVSGNRATVLEAGEGGKCFLKNVV